MQSFIIQNIEIILTRKRIKHLILRVSPEGQVKLSAPLRCSQQHIESFLHHKIDWIIQSKSKVAVQARAVVSSMKSGDVHWYWGEPYTIMLQLTTLEQKIMLEGDQLSIYTHEKTSEDEQIRRLHHWHREQMRLVMPELIQKWERIIGVHALFWGVKPMKTRWGSCHILTKRIWLNLHLIHHPVVCLEYVIVHELVHLLEPSHNQRFHTLMTQFMPNWKRLKQRLNRGDEGLI